MSDEWGEDFPGQGQTQGQKHEPGHGGQGCGPQAEMHFPVCRVQSYLEQGMGANSVSMNAAIYLAGDLKSLTGEILTYAGQAANEDKQNNIKEKHIVSAVTNNADLNALFGALMDQSEGTLPCKRCNTKDGVVQQSEKTKAVPTFGNFMNKILEQEQPGKKLSKKAQCVLGTAINDVAERIANEAERITNQASGMQSTISSITTLSPGEIQTAVRNILTGDLAEHVESGANEALQMYGSNRKLGYIKGRALMYASHDRDLGSDDQLMLGGASSSHMVGQDHMILCAAFVAVAFAGLKLIKKLGRHNRDA